MPSRLPSALALGVAMVLVSAAAFANQPPVIDSFTASAAWVTPGGTLTLTVIAHDPDCTGTCSTGCGLYIRPDLTVWGATAGSFIAQNNGAPGSPYTANATWLAPSTEGTITLSVTLADSGTSFGCGGRMTASASINVAVSNTPPNLPPVIARLTADKTQLKAESQANLLCSASDPDGDPITFSWAATAGTVTAGAPGSAVFQAPSSPGPVIITCTVSDGRGGSSSATVSVTAIDVTPDRSLTGSLVAPQKLAALASNTLYVVDQSWAGGGLVMLDARSGEPQGFISLPGVTSVAVDWQDRLLVGDPTGARVLGAIGLPLMNLNPREQVGGVSDVAVDSSGHRYVVLYGQTGRVIVFDGSGAVVSAFGSNGDGSGQFRGAQAVAVTPTGGVVVADSGHGLLQVFDATGSFLLAMGGLGGGAGKFVQLAGLAVDSTGVLLATDSFQSQITVFNPDGTLREILGGYGSDLGMFKTPTGILVRSDTREIYVASTNGPSIEVFTIVAASWVQPPTPPVPSGPLAGAVLALGSAVTLAAGNATDPQRLPLAYVFELDQVVGGASVTLRTWSVPENPTGTTSVDATTAIPGAGTYTWKARAYNGSKYSSWTADQTFQVEAPPPPINLPPSAPTLASPDGLSEVATLIPDLLVTNATDPNGDPLSYIFEVSLLVSGGNAVVAISPFVASGSGLTPWQVPAGTLAESQLVFWRCRAFDGNLHGDWSPFGQFWTPPFSIPAYQELGHIPGGDQTRPGEIRLTFPARSTGATLYFQVYDVTSDMELTLEVNGTHTHAVAAQVAGAWSPTLELAIPASELNAGAPNRLRFLHPGLSDSWGVRSVSFTPISLVPRLSAVAFNTVVDVRWAQAADLPAGSLVRLYRAQGVSGPFFPLGDHQPSAGLYRDIALLNGESYRYKACYVDPKGEEGAFSQVVAATPSTAGGVTPITDLKLVPRGSDLLLTWTPITSEPALQSIEIYSNSLGLWGIDTVGFTNQVAIVAGIDGQYLLPGGVRAGPDSWYLAIPLDMAGARGTP